MRIFAAVLLVLALLGCKTQTVLFNGKKMAITKTLRECNGKAGIVLSKDSSIGEINGMPVIGISDECQVVMDDGSR